MFKTPLRSGMFNGKEYVGEVVEKNGEFEGSIHQVPTDELGGMYDVVCKPKTFSTKNEAEDYVRSEWEKKFNTCK